MHASEANVLSHTVLVVAPTGLLVWNEYAYRLLHVACLLYYFMFHTFTNVSTHYYCDFWQTFRCRTKKKIRRFEKLWLGR